MKKQTLSHAQKAEQLKNEIERDKMIRAEKVLKFMKDNNCEVSVVMICEEGKAPTFRKSIIALD